MRSGVIVLLLGVISTQPLRPRIRPSGHRRRCQLGTEQPGQAPRLRLSWNARHDCRGDRPDARLLWQRAASCVLQRLLERRTAGADGGAAISRRLRRHHRRRPVIAAAQSLLEGVGRDTVTRVCASACHGPGPIAASRFTGARWQEIVDDMIGRGAEVAAADRPVILGYLTRTLGGVDAQPVTPVPKAPQANRRSAPGMPSSDHEPHRLAEALEVPDRDGQRAAQHRWRAVVSWRP
jgi:hypothetical protein